MRIADQYRIKPTREQANKIDNWRKLSAISY
ncbi:helix-turn-helix domain-containing protein [Moorena producens JHB]|uniref:Helix-turn-helix domain-containing protein n=1 Tax=Moorena producens (strain JHB) TaxID=1454205 RepID=A0A9Q9SSK0_MOOP1|nr:helix-turn-helix domain-containing protein [Moorena producens]WAN68873.1 helix-turn-helix domain-containing protein [Moorena producens JHB]